MKTIPISSITIPPERQRRDHPAGPAQLLFENIRENGLLHPIVLRAPSTLAAGERRLRAVADLHALGLPVLFEGQPLPPGEIPYTLLGDLPPLQAEEVELAENIHRLDLPWQDRVRAEARIIEIRRALAAAEGRPEPTLPEIAETAFGGDISQMPLSNSQRLAKSLHIPEVAAAPSTRDAIKALRKHEQKARNRLMGEALGPAFSSSSHTLLIGDCREHLASLEAASIDIILSDPPYGMGADTFGDSGGRAEAHGYEDSYESWLSLMDDVIPELSRIAKPESFLYLFCDIDRFHELRERIRTAGWTPFRTPLLWHKPHGSRAPWPQQGPQRKYECILYAVRGKRSVERMVGDVLTHGPDAQLDHAAQKPVSLYEDLLARVARPGDRVLDFCAGTGPIFPAAHGLRVIATGIELDPSYAAIGASRIRGLS